MTRRVLGSTADVPALRAQLEALSGGTLRAIVPTVLAEALDWSTLTLRPGSFVDAALTHQHTDLLYSTTWRHGGEALVYLLFEHQSTPPTEGLMAYRLLRYQDGSGSAGAPII